LSDTGRVRWFARVFCVASAGNGKSVLSLK
jgi:hypothetical protein